ncbi:hypothetical protein Tco_0764603 [Tanacetum coccineum]
MKRGIVLYGFCQSLVLTRYARVDILNTKKYRIEMMQEDDKANSKEGIYAYLSNYEVTCEEEAKRRNFGTIMKTFEESTKTATIRHIQQGRYGVSAPAHHKKRVIINSLYGVSTASLYAVYTVVTSVNMDDPNITMEEYIRLEDEMVQSRGETFNWQTATFGRTRTRGIMREYDNEREDFETEFPAIVFNNTSDTTPPCEPTNEFPAIVYNDGLTSKSDFRTEPTVCPQHIDEFDLKDETSLSECNEKEQNVLYFNDLFPFKVIYPDDLKSNTDNDMNENVLSKPLGDMVCITITYCK